MIMSSALAPTESVSTLALRPGDFLPPQAALHGSRWQHTGFQIGRRHRDVGKSPVNSAEVLAFGVDGGRPLVLRAGAEVVIAARTAAAVPAPRSAA